MNSEKPLILISNDDGYHSVGLRSLVEMVAPLADVLVCAPESARSGFSCAFSAEPPLRLKPRRGIAGAEVWSCDGTPVDCVKLAFSQLCAGRKPVLVLGGINHGDNSTVNTHYSGTMGVALEGCLKGVPSVAFSYCSHLTDVDLSHLTPYVRRIVSRVLSEGLPGGVCLNVNFPCRPTFEGVRVCRMTRGEWINEVVPQQHPRGHHIYWMVGEYRNDEPQAPDTDQWAIAHGYVAITPTQIDVTAYSAMDLIRGWEL